MTYVMSSRLDGKEGQDARNMLRSTIQNETPQFCPHDALSPILALRGSPNVASEVMIMVKALPDAQARVEHLFLCSRIDLTAVGRDEHQDTG